MAKHYNLLFLQTSLSTKLCTNMKKALFVGITAFTLSAAAQTADRISSSSGKFDFNIKAGLSLSNPKYNPGHSQKTSFYAGIAGEYAVSNEASLNLGLEYIENGTKDNEGSLTAINVSQLNIPLTLKVYALDPLYLEAGAYAGFILSAEGEFEGTNVDLNEFEDMDYGALFGIGADFGDLFIEARYNLGLKYLIDTEQEEINFDPIVSEPFTRYRDYKNRFFQIGVGYKF